MNVKLETLIRKIDEGNIIYTDEESYNRILEDLKDDEINLTKVKARVIVEKKEEEKEGDGIHFDKIVLNDKPEIKPNRRERRRRERALNKFINKNKLKF